MATLPCAARPDSAVAFAPTPAAALRELGQALRAIRYGSIELVIHDGRVVQLERREKVRVDTDRRYRTRQRTPGPGTDRTAGSPPLRQLTGGRRCERSGLRVSGIILASGSVATAPQAVGATGRDHPGQRPSKQRVDELDQQIRILQRLRELAADSVDDGGQGQGRRPPPAKDGFSIKSADGKYAVRFRATSRRTAASFCRAARSRSPTTFFLRRARPDPRGHRRQVLRLPPHARLRPGPRRRCSTPTPT